MAQYEAQYRARLKEPRSLNDATESQILTVGATPFQVATVDGVTGYEPIMEEPRGRRGRLDALTKSPDTGSLSIILTDRRLSTGNASRWVTQFLGNSAGENQFSGCLFEIDESLDCDPTAPAGATWTRFFTGRVETSKKLTDIAVVLVIRDLSEELEADVFVGRPHSSIAYYAETRLWPLGIRGSWATFPAGATLLGTVGNASKGTGKSVTLGSAALADVANSITEALTRYGIQLTTAGSVHASRIRVVTTAIRARLVRQDTLAVGEYHITTIIVRIVPAVAGGKIANSLRIEELLLTPVAAGDEGFLAIPPDATSVSLEIVPALARPTPAAPLLLNDVHPVQLAKDLLDGKFTYRNADGTVKRTWKYNAANVAALIADTTFGTMRFAITGVKELRDFLDKQLCQPGPLAYRLNADGELVFIDMRIPTAASPTATTITDADLFEDTPVDWEQGREGAIVRMAVGYKFDAPTESADLSLSQGILSGGTAALFKTLDREIVKPDFGRLDLGDKSFTIEADGLRAALDERHGLQDAEDALLGRIEQLMNHYRSPFGSGPMTVVLPCRRTANTNGVQPGDWRLIAVTTLPDPATNLRGGTRLMRCIERSEQGLALELRFLDAGPNVVRAAPTFGALTAPVANAVGIPVTLNASSDWVQLETAVTATSVALLANVPAGAWKVRQNVAASSTVVLTGFPSGMRVWVRGKSITGFSHAPGIDSGYASPATAFRDIAALAAPTGFAVSQINALSARLTWTVGSATHGMKLRLVTPSAGTPTQIIAQLPPGTNFYQLQGTEDAATYKARLTHSDGAGGESAAVDVTWTATGTAPTCPAPFGLSIADTR